MGGGRPALPRGEARNLRLRVGALVLQGEPVLACLGMTVTLEPIGGASAQGLLMANGIGWEEDNEGMIPGPSWCLWPPFCFAPRGLLELTSHVSRGSPVPTVLVSGGVFPSPQ